MANSVDPDQKPCPADLGIFHCLLRFVYPINWFPVEHLHATAIHTRGEYQTESNCPTTQGPVVQS